MQAPNNTGRVHRFLLIRLIQARPRLFLSVLLGVAVAVFLPQTLVERAITRLILGWNAGAWLYLLLAIRMMFWSGQHTIRRQAQLQDEGKFIVLLLVILAVAASLGAIVAELSVVKEMQGAMRYAHIALVIMTIMSSWIFMHVMFAQHYAHDYYVALSRKESGGLHFPGETMPDYADFLYFSCAIGTSGQTADVSFTSKGMRRVGLVHNVLAFFFNTILLALSINIAAGMF